MATTKGHWLRFPVRSMETMVQKGVRVIVRITRSWNLSFLDYSSFAPSKSIRPNRLLLSHAQSGACLKTSSITAKASPESTNNSERRSANYPPSVWEDGYIQSLRIDSMGDDVDSQLRKLKEEVRNLLGEGTELVRQLKIVDALQQLGVAYHFEKEIKDVLTTMYRSKDNTIMEMKDDLYATSLFFRLLREHGFHISPDIFNNFKDKKGSFNTNLSNDINGILSLYEASFLAVEGENQMDEARQFTTNCLKDLTTRFSIEPSLKEKVTHALELPLHWRMQRLHTRWFIDQYEREEDMPPSLLKLAKLDFNMLQGIYKKELKELSSWWMNLGLGQSLGFARDRLVENYLWALGYTFEPKFSRTRKAMAKDNCFITLIDDVYDVHGSLEELKLFTDAVIRWETGAIEQLPNYMKILFIALFNSTNDTAYKILKVKGIYVLPNLKRAWTDLCKSYLIEAKWFTEGYTPTLKEYLDNAWISISGHITLTLAYCMSDDLTEEALECFNFYPDVVRHSSMLLRLHNDLATSTAELERGDVPKSIQCYMHESGVTEAIAREQISEMVTSTWKKLNGDRIANSSFVESFKKVALNIPRMSQCIYLNGDGYGEPGGETKDQIISLLIDPVPL